MDEFAAFSGIRRADAVIIGAGLTGLMTAAALAEAGMRVIVLDAEEPGSGASGLCSGAVTLQAVPVYAQIVRVHGHDAALQHVERLQSLLAELPDYFAHLAPFREVESYVYAFLPRDLPALEAQQRLCADLGLPVSYAPDAGGCPFPVELSTRLAGQLMVDTGALLTALTTRIRSRGGSIHSQSRVISLENGRACTSDGCVVAPITLLTAGKPLGDARSRTLALLESRTMVSCRLTSSVPLHTLQQSVRAGGLNLTPIPGGAEASWCAGRCGTPEEAERIALLTRVICGRLKDWEASPFLYRQDIWPLDGLPVIGALPDYGGRVFCATGYSGHGVLGAALASRVLTGYILGHSNPLDSLYSPDRALPHELLSTSRRRLRRFRRWAALRRRAPVCTLCRGRLRYCIPSERWECPICGSAYGMLGRLLGSPAVRDGRISALQRPDL